MTAVESSATPAMTADKGNGTAVADLAMTDDCRVGHVSTVRPATGRRNEVTRVGLDQGLHNLRASRSRVRGLPDGRCG